MKKTMTSVLTIALLGLAGCAQVPGDTSAAASTTQLFAGIDAGGPGCSVTVGRGGDVVFEGSYGMADVERGIPIDATTGFDIASVAKQFTGTVILQLAQVGALSLDDTAGRWIPDLPGWAAAVTVDQLLHQTSGIPDYVEPLLSSGAELTDPTTNADVLAALRTVPPPAGTPGSTYEYSNSNYVLLAEVAVASSGIPFPQLIAEKIFTPLGLGMRVDPTGATGGRAVGYGRDVETGPWAPVDVRWEQVGDGAVVATTADLVRWSSQYWNPTVGGADVAAGRVEGPVPTGVELFGGLSYGAGVMIGALPDGRAVVGHEGQWGGFETSWAAVPEAQLAVAVSCNGNGLLTSEVPAADLIEAWLGEPVDQASGPPTPAPVGGVQGVLTEWEQASVPAGTAGGVAVAMETGSGTTAVGAVGGVTAEGAFRLGSLTKTYVAAALLRLTELGRVDLDAPVERYVPDVPGGDAVTIRQILDQVSGLPDYLRSATWRQAVIDDPDRAWTLRDVLTLTAGMPLGQVGAFEYSNTNYVVAGLVLEAVTGTGAAEALRRLVFDPLGLAATTYGAQGREIPEGYAVLDEGGPAQPVSGFGSYRAVETTAGTAGAVVATPADVVRFGRALLEGRATGEPGWELLRSFPDGPSYSFGLGDLTDPNGGLPRWGNVGQIPGHTAVLMLYPSTGDVVAVTATDHRIAVDALLDLADRLQRTSR